MDRIQELQLDREELKRFLDSAARSNVRQLLVQEIAKLDKLITDETALRNRTAKTSNPSAVVNGADAKPVEKKMPKLYTAKITSYGWDETANAVKVYVTLAGVDASHKDNVTVDFGERSFELMVNNVLGKNHNLSIKNLVDEIVPAKSSYKCKKDSVVIILHKAKAENWGHLTAAMKKKTEAKAPKFDKDDDPSAGIMGMMKQMYQDGDDDMKRTIAKAWTDARNKEPGAGAGLGM